MKTRKPLPYWLGGGTETCSICLQTYVLEMEYRCSGCDQGVCEQCAVVVRERVEVFCSDCPPREV